MKVGRSIGISVAVLAVIFVAGVIYILSSLNSIVAAAIEKYGSQATQTPVRVSSVKIDLKAGSGAVEQLSVGNPNGFSEPNIFTLGGIGTRLNVASIGEDPIVIEEIRIDSPAVFYEINQAGASNIKELQKNVEQSSSGGGQTAAETSESSGPKLVIRKLIIEGGTIDAKVAALKDKALSAELPRIQLKDIGEKSGGATGTEVARQVIDAIIAKVGPAVANLGLEEYLDKGLDEAKARLNEKVGDKLGDKSTEGLKKLLDE